MGGVGVQPRATTGRKRTRVWYHILDARAEKHKEIVVAVVSNVAQRERGAVPSLVTQRKGLLQTVRAALHARLGMHLRDACRGSVASLTRGIRTQRIAGGILKKSVTVDQAIAKFDSVFMCLNIVLRVPYLAVVA